jgi:hypothetical protein
MEPEEINTVKDAFLTWSGGFPPDSEQQIFIYMEYAHPDDADNADEVRRMLWNWMCSSDSSLPPP